MTESRSAPGDVHLNGVDAVSGEYATPALRVEDLARAAQGKPLEPEHLEELKARKEAAVAHYGVGFGIDPENLLQAGWGALFPHDADPAIRAALAPLLEARKAEAGRLYAEFAGPDGHRPGETCRTFLARHGAGPGPCDPDVFPYYVLLVGDPERIPYRFQFELDVNYAVGRVHFESIDEYARYARSVVEAESVAARARRRAVLFGTRNPDDFATEASAQQLIAPLAQHLAARAGQGWAVEPVLAGDATAEKLAHVLSATEAPALLFTATHGMVFPPNDPRLLQRQGALLCQDWPGPYRHQGPIPDAWCFSAAEVPAEPDLRGLVAFFFACYGAGTPRYDDFAHAERIRAEIAPRAFLAALPRKLLGREGGGALAAVGHVERAWTFSFSWPGAGEQVVTFRSALEALMSGRRLGAAMEVFAMKLADLSVALAGELEDVKFGKRPDELALANLWTANNDARNYTIVGDPAVRSR